MKPKSKYFQFISALQVGLNMDRKIINGVEKALHYKARIKIVIRRTAVTLWPLIWTAVLKRL
jgi:hypothetical protein